MTVEDFVSSVMKQLEGFKLVDGAVHFELAASSFPVSRKEWEVTAGSGSSKLVFTVLQSEATTQIHQS